jgi:hypothetical protein
MDRGPRQRRLVRLASELRTTITAIERRLRDQRAVWMGVGAVALAFALALLTALLRDKPRRPAPVPPATTMIARPAAVAQSDSAPAQSEPVAAANPVALAAAEAGPSAEGGAASAAAEPDARTPNGTRPASAGRTATGTSDAPMPGTAGRASAVKRLPTLGSVDGTPLFTEPGF